jgi:hypothetical protein
MNCPLGNPKCTRYVVKPSSSGWVGCADGREYGPYLSRDMALQLAVADVRQRRKAGKPVRLVVEAGGGAVSADRCLCPEMAP